MSRFIHRIASRIMKFMIRTWKLTNTSIQELDFTDLTSLDAVTRQLPEGYYSTFRTFAGCRRVLGLSAHLQRLYEPVSTPDVSESFLRRQLVALLEHYRPDESRVRVMMTQEGQTYITLEPLKRLPRHVYESGVRVETTEMQRESPRLKSTAFIRASDVERRYLAQEGIFEALLVKDGKILEGMTSNFFYVGQVGNLPYLGTACDDILLGITRQTVIDIARGRGLEVRYELLELDRLAAVSEAFITSSSRGIVPVVQIDNLPVGQGSPGPITKQLVAAYEAYVMEKAESIAMVE